MPAANGRQAIGHLIRRHAAPVGCGSFIADAGEPKAQVHRGNSIVAIGSAIRLTRIAALRPQTSRGQRASGRFFKRGLRRIALHGDSRFMQQVRAQRLHMRQHHIL